MISSFHRFRDPAPRWAVPLLILVCLVLELPGLGGLPPMDRDEPRFAQASRQMLETGDYVAIRFQDEARNKKPVGIYWLQAGAVALGERLGVPDARRRIWLYRVPSLLGAILAVLGTYWTALAVTSRRAALWAGLLFASTVILTAEAHLAKTDAVLCATVVFAMGSLTRLYLAARRGETPALPVAAVFWTAIGVGILVKGPITPMVPALAIVVLCVRDRSVQWLRALRPGLGLLWVVVLVTPWLAMILLRTHGAFLTESVGQDMLGKASGGQEAHGAPPGTYLVAFWLTAWPMAPLAALAVPGVWRRWREAPVFVLLAWLAPTWLLFELVPTKLPHYVLPVYPAVAILTAAMLDEGTVPRLRAPLAKIVIALLLALLPIGIAVVLGLGRSILWTQLGAGTVVVGGVAILAAIAAALWVIRSLAAGDAGRATWGVVAAAACVYLFTFGDLLTPHVSDLLNLSGRVTAAGRSAVAPGCPDPALVSAGDHEPSLVFTSGTDILLTDSPAAADFVKQAPCRVAFIESHKEPAFLAALGDTPLVTLAGRVAGTAVNGGKHLDIGVYVRQRGQP